MDHPVRHNEESGRFHARVDGHDCVLDYALDDGRMTITHTRVPEAVGGRGIAAALTRAALDIARERGWRVIPACAYARIYFERHPDQADLLA